MPQKFEYGKQKISDKTALSIFFYTTYSEATFQRGKKVVSMAECTEGSKYLIIYVTDKTFKRRLGLGGFAN